MKINRRSAILGVLGAAIAKLVSGNRVGAETATPIPASATYTYTFGPANGTFKVLHPIPRGWTATDTDLSVFAYEDLPYLLSQVIPPPVITIGAELS